MILIFFVFIYIVSQGQVKSMKRVDIYKGYAVIFQNKSVFSFTEIVTDGTVLW